MQGGAKGIQIPVFGNVTTPEAVEQEKRERALKLKDVGGKRFAAEDYNGALQAYVGALQVEALLDSDAAKVHANMAACLLKQGGEERAAKALRAAVEAYELDPTYGKAYFRAAQALEILGEKEAAAEAQAKADELIAIENAAKKAKNDILKQKWATKEARDAKLKEEKEREAYNNTFLTKAPVQPYDPSAFLVEEIDSRRHEEHGHGHGGASQGQGHVHDSSCEHGPEINTSEGHGHGHGHGHGSGGCCDGC